MSLPLHSPAVSELCNALADPHAWRFEDLARAAGAFPDTEATKPIAKEVERQRANRKQVKTRLARELVTPLRQLRNSYDRSRAGNGVPKLYPDEMEELVNSVTALVAEFNSPDGEGAWVGIE